MINLFFLGSYFEKYKGVIRFFLLLVIIFLFNCKPPYNTPKYRIPPSSYLEYYNKGVRFEQAHDYKKALHFFKEALKFVTEEEFPLKRRYWRAYFMMLRQYEHMGEYEKAYKGYLELFKRAPKDQYAPYALYRASVLSQEKLKDRAIALLLLKKLILVYPDSGITTSAVKYLIKCYGEREDVAYILKELESKVKGRDIAPKLLFEAGKLLVKVGKKDEGLKLIQEMIRNYPYPYNSLWDDGVWYLANFYEEKKDWDKAIYFYELLVSKLEPSYFTATYNSQWTDDSLLKLGELYYYKKGNWEKAIFYLKILAKEVEYSLSDEGMLLLAKIYRDKRKEKEACYWLDYMRKEKDYANRLREAISLYNSLGCKNNN